MINIILCPDNIVQDIDSDSLSVDKSMDICIVLISLDFNPLIAGEILSRETTGRNF